MQTTQSVKANKIKTEKITTEKKTKGTLYKDVKVYRVNRIENHNTGDISKIKNFDDYLNKGVNVYAVKLKKGDKAGSYEYYIQSKYYVKPAKKTLAQMQTEKLANYKKQGLSVPEIYKLIEKGVFF